MNQTNTLEMKIVNETINEKQLYWWM